MGKQLTDAKKAEKYLKSEQFAKAAIFAAKALKANPNNALAKTVRRSNKVHSAQFSDADKAEIVKFKLTSYFPALFPKNVRVKQDSVAPKTEGIVAGIPVVLEATDITVAALLHKEIEAKAAEPPREAAVAGIAIGTAIGAIQADAAPDEDVEEEVLGEGEEDFLSEAVGETVDDGIYVVVDPADKLTAAMEDEAKGADNVGAAAPVVAAAAKEPALAANKAEAAAAQPQSSLLFTIPKAAADAVVASLSKVFGASS